jgi:hypothetical protein
MKIEKVGKEVKKGYFKATYQSTPLEGNTPKMKARYDIEKNVIDGDSYDIYDMFADLANAFNELRTGTENGPAMKKWDERQSLIKDIIS